MALTSTSSTAAQIFSYHGFSRGKMSVSTSVSPRIYYYSFNSLACTKALLCREESILSYEVMSGRVSSHTNMRFLKPDVLPLPSFGVPDSLKYGGNKVKLPYGSQVPFPPFRLTIKANYPQNLDLPRYRSKKERKPFPIPVAELRRIARARRNEGRPIPPPKRGLLVRALIPVAYEVLNARVALINNLKKLLKVVPVHACKWCDDVHVGPDGHPFKTCGGQFAPIRSGLHEWTNACVENLLVPVESYHLFDRLGKRICHEERLSVPRIPAVVELCIQAGVEIPEYPTKRRRRPAIRIGKHQFVDQDESKLPDPVPTVPETPILTEIPDSEATPPSTAEERITLATETLQTWETLRQGALRLMKAYTVRVCGYCPEVYVGPLGHAAQNCGARKHQQRNGKHGWQAAVLDDLIPPKYAWHLPDASRAAPLKRELMNFYGQAPAVVEMCVQAGAAVLEQYKPTMRLDVGVPTDAEEVEMAV